MASISRWSLTFFSCALGAFVVALGLMVFGFGYPSAPVLAPQTLIVVHLLAIGWLTLLMMGALFQFLPVLVGRELAWAGLTPFALVMLLLGLGMLLTGFAGLNWDGVSTKLLPIGGLLLIGGFAATALALVGTMLRARNVSLPAAFVAVAVVGALVTALLGESLASALAGLLGDDQSLVLVTHGVPLHAGFGLGGWLTFAAMGVSYRLISMFLIAPERTGWRPRLVFWSGLLALLMLCGELITLFAANTVWLPGLIMSGAFALVCVVLYLLDVFTLYRTRRRTSLELHTKAAIAAFGMLTIGCTTLVAASKFGSEVWFVAAVYLLALGWLSGLGLAMLYKIVAFLTWLECFAPTMGRSPTPRVQDLVREHDAKIWFTFYFGAVTVGACAILVELPLLLRAASALQLLATLMLGYHFYRARCLADLPEQWRNHPKPRLFFPSRRRGAIL